MEARDFVPRCGRARATGDAVRRVRLPHDGALPLRRGPLLGVVPSAAELLADQARFVVGACPGMNCCWLFPRRERAAPVVRCGAAT